MELPLASKAQKLKEEALLWHTWPQAPQSPNAVAVWVSREAT